MVVEPELLNWPTIKFPIGFGLAPLIVGVLSLFPLVERERVRGGEDALVVVWFSLLPFLFVRPSQFKRIL